MPEELDADVTVVDTVPADDSNDDDSGSNGGDSDSGGTVDVPEENIQRIDLPDRDDAQPVEDNETSSTTDSSSGSSSPREVTRQPIDEEGNPTGSEEVLQRGQRSFSEGTTQKEARQQTNSNEVQLTDLQNREGFRVTQDQLQEKIRNDNTEALSPAEKTSRSAKIQSRRNRRQNILQEKKDELRQESKLPGIDRNNIVVGSRPNPLDNAARDFFNPNRQVSDNLNTAGEAVLAGQDIIRSSEQFGENVEKKIPDQLNFLGSGVGGPVAGAELAGRGQIIEGVETAVIPGNQNQLEEKRSRQAREGVFAGPGTLLGFGVGGAGAVAKAGEQELRKIQGQETEGPGLGGSAVQGGGLILDRVSDNPGRFAANEIGEEIGEGIATAGIGLAVPTITPDITPTVKAQTPETLQTSANFITGNLGTRARDPDTRINLEDTELLQREFVENPEGDGRAQIVEGFRFTEGGTKVSTGGGVRRETPLSRREFLAERTGLKDAELADLLPTNSRRGTTSGIPLVRESNPETTPDSTPETDSSPDLSPEDLFRDTPRQDARPLPDEFSVSSGRLNAVLEQGLDQSQDQGQGEGLGLGLDQTSINQQDTGQEIDTPFDNSVESRGRIDQTLDQRQEEDEETFLDPRITNSNSNTATSPGFGFEDEGNGDDSFDLISDEQSRSISRSVGADLLDIEDRDLTREEASNPLSLRGGRF